MNSELIKRFIQYAADFELCYEDDDWSRVYSYLSADASYEIIGEPVACVLHGPENIFAGIKKSLDGFDRRFDQRTIAARGDFITTESSLSLDWQGTYLKKGCPDLVIEGTSVLHYGEVKDSEGQEQNCERKIIRFSDRFEAESLTAFESWTAHTGILLDISYR